MARTIGSVNRQVNVKSARYRIWRAMRIMRRFTMADLCATAEAGRWNVQQYVLGLIRAQYVVLVMAQRRRGIGGGTIYTLARDTGPNPPRLRKDETIFDPNLVERRWK
jgi:hypothetical protein